MGTIFHKSVRGANHIASQKPCQDYSISYEECGMTIAVVCDGHGGSTYFRSDTGAKLAAEITLDLHKSKPINGVLHPKNGLHNIFIPNLLMMRAEK